MHFAIMSVKECARRGASMSVLTLVVAILARGSLASESAQDFVPAAAAPVIAKNAPAGAVTMGLAREALTAGREREAALLFAKAIGELVDPAPALIELLKIAGADPSAHALYSHALVAEIADASGKWKLPRETESLLYAEGDHVAKVARARATAAAELAKFAATMRGKSKSAGGTLRGARFAAEYFLELAGRSPQLVSAHAPAINGALSGWSAEYKPVIAALEALADELLASKSPGEATLAARIILGLVSQAGFEDLEGPDAPDLARIAADARRTLARAREALGTQRGEPLTVAQLEAMSPQDRVRFTSDHSSFENPGIAFSTTSRYLIETSCGFETLLGAAKTVELHHQRLVEWFGGDPFLKRQGIVRIVPEHAGLEAEGTPFWWAGGFQSGDVTTVHFAVSNIESLGRTLTHELTHRFDGEIYPGMPGWLAEGRAVWTGAAYGGSTDAKFVANHVSIGTVEDAYIKGYGGRENLEKLISGTIDDYRDNYVAGYALFVYLNYWRKDGRALFAAQLPGYMKALGRSRDKPLELFKAAFVDGKDGRPSKWEEFASAFAIFLKGFHWQSREPWVLEIFTNHTPRGARADWIYDAPTWNPERERAEPWFGQDQAREAGLLLLKHEKKDAALLALLWSLEVDEPDPAVLAITADLLEAAKEDDLAWILRAGAAMRSPMAAGAAFTLDPAIGAAPFLKSLDRTVEYLTTLAAAARADHARGAVVSATALASDHDRLAARLGMAPLALDAGAAAAPSTIRATQAQAQDCLHPLDEPATPLWKFGLVEDKLSGYDQRRVADLWFVNEDGDIEVGRARPQEGTSDLDRGLYRRDSFVRTREWLAPGRYVIKTRVYMTVSFVSGAVVIGSTRRDRNIRFGFTAGDYLYSAGEKDSAARLDSISWSLGGLRPRDGGLGGARPSGEFTFDEEKSSFWLTLLVDGPEIHAFIEDEWVAAYHTIDGAPIEGAVGFAVDWGAVRVQTPTVRRLDRTSASGLERIWPQGLRLDVDSPLRGEQLHNRHCRGLPADAHANGLLVIWQPPIVGEDPEFPTDQDELARELLAAAIQAETILSADRLELGVVVVAPHDLEPTALTILTEGLKRDTEDRVPLLTHRHTHSLAPAAEVEGLFVERPSLLLIDSSGVLRQTGLIYPGMEHLDGDLAHWARVLGAPRK